MFPTIITALTLQTLVRLTSVQTALPSLPKKQHLIASKNYSLSDRQPNPWVNSIFKDNILLTLAYMDGAQSHSEAVDWNRVEQPFHYSFELEPGQTFAYHEDVLDKYQGSVVKTTTAHFNSQEGFKSDGYLVGDGVCHLASFFNEIAKNAGLGVEAPTNHDFATIADVDRRYGTAIYFQPGDKGTNSRENLYVTNTLDKPVEFDIDYYNSDALKLSIYEED